MYLYSYENLLKEAKTQKGKEYLEKIKACYEKDYENKPILALPFSKFKLFHLTGDRTKFQNEYFDRRKRLMLLQLLAISNDKYIEPLEDIISAICDELVWSLPAHCLDRETGNTYIYSEIDLNASETALSLAETLYVLGDKLCPDIKKRIKHTLKEKIVDVCETTILPMDRMKNNWAPVCACGIGLTYLYIFPERFNIVKDRIFSAMERYINKLDEDGYCSEGFAYWVYGFGFFATFYDAYCQLTEERPAILDIERVKNSIKYAENSILGDGVFVPISDGALSNKACECDTIPVVNHLFNANVKINGAKPNIPYYKAIGFRRLYHINQTVQTEIKNTANSYFEKSQVLVEKRKNYIFISKGGNNAEMHNHNDIGAFSIFKNGVQYIVDPGAGEYTAGYFGNINQRYSKETFTCSAYAHSVPVVDNQIQVYGKEYFATVLGRGDDFIEYDLTNAYPKKIETLTVKYSFGEKEVNALYNVKGIEKEISFRFISFIEPKIKGNEVVINDLTITCDKDAKSLISTYNYSNHQAQSTIAYAIDYIFSSDITAKFSFKFKD